MTTPDPALVQAARAVAEKLKTIEPGCYGCLLPTCAGCNLALDTIAAFGAAQRAQIEDVLARESTHAAELRASPLGTPPGIDMDAARALLHLHRDLWVGDFGRIVLLLAEYRCVARIEGRHELLLRIAAALRAARPEGTR